MEGGAFRPLCHSDFSDGQDSCRLHQGHGIGVTVECEGASSPVGEAAHLCSVDEGDPGCQGCIIRLQALQAFR